MIAELNKTSMEFRIEKDTMGEVKVPAMFIGVHKQNVLATILKLVLRQVCQKKLFMLLLT